MVQLESEKTFYKKIMQQNMVKEIEIEKSMKKLTIHDKDQKERELKQKKLQEEEETITEWTTSRPETREFGCSKVKKGSDIKKKKLKPFKSTSIYDRNAIKPS